MNHKNALIFGLSNSKQLAELVAKKTNIKNADYTSFGFADGEIFFRSNEVVRGKNVYLIQSTSKPVNNALMELFIAIDSVKRASAHSITVIIPYYGYARQDRKSKGREPITSRLIADMLETAGAERVLTLDIHSPQQQGFFSVPFDSLTASWSLLEEFFEKYKNKLNHDDITIVSPDYGGVKRAREIAERLKVELAIIDKRRPRPNEVEIENILGNVKGKHCIIPDDMIDTGGTMISVARLIKSQGAKSVDILATHGLFNGKALENFEQAFKDNVIDHLFTTNTIDNTSLLPAKINVVDISDLIANAINIFESGTGSISKIYSTYKHTNISSNKKDE